MVVRVGVVKVPAFKVALPIALLAVSLAACDSSNDWRHHRTASGNARSTPCDSENEDSIDGLPNSLACAGLYADLASKEVAEGVREYSPAVPLWSDGAEKRRWISLPMDTQIDASANGDWVFPVGTSFFKEFSVDGRRVETRLFRKAREDRWVRTSYQWAEDEASATRSDGVDLEEVQLSGTTYHIPTGRECDQCHEGRQDRILGFEAVSLGLPGAQGVTLAQLVEDELLAPAPELTSLEIGDDGTGSAAPALGWLHVNCGVSCHNDNSNSEAYSTRLRLRLDPNELDGRASNDFPTLATTRGVHGKNLRWQEEVRIIPGDPEASLLYKLVKSRAGKNDQMPPIASRVVDEEHREALALWIRAMGDGDDASESVER